MYLKTIISPESGIATGTWLIYKHHLLVSTNRFDDANLQSLVSQPDMEGFHHLRVDQGSLAILDRIYQCIAWQLHVVGLNRRDYLHHCIE